MTKKTRTILFLILFFFFLILGPSIVFYSLGYRLDWQKKQIAQTGAFYFKVSPKNTKIYINGKLKKKTDWFFGAAFIENLLPKKYEIEIKKQGYHAWSKELEIKEKQATEAKNIVLIPEKIEPEVLLKNVKGLWLSPDKKRAVLKEQTEQGWGLKLYNLEKKVKSRLISEKDISLEEIDLLALKFSSDSQTILLKIKQGGGFKHFILNLAETKPDAVELDFLNEKDQDIGFVPKTNSKLLTLRQNSLYLADANKKTLSPEILANILAYRAERDNIYYLENSGHVFKTSFSFSEKEKITNLPLPTKPDQKYEINVFDGRIFLKQDNALYFVSQEGLFEKLAADINNFEISPDQQKLVYFSESEIWILFLKETFNQPQKKQGETIFLLRLSEKIKGCVWLNSHYLIFSAGNEIKIAETDNRDRLNIVSLSQFENPKIFWDSAGKNLYILSQEQVLSAALAF